MSSRTSHSTHYPQHQQPSYPSSSVATLRHTNMATQVATATNGIKANGKIKSKNQLRRLKAKQKKAGEKDKVCTVTATGLTGSWY